MTDQGPADRRHFHRVGHDARATLSYAGRAWSCTVQDLSLKGCLVRLHSEWQVDPRQAYHLTIHLSDEISIGMDVASCRQQGQNVGLHCVNIDLDSVTRLRRLVELNLGDCALLERDLHALVSP